MIEVRGLWKYYGGTAAVQDLSFSVKPGDVLGLLGPNGSGKSTTVNMLTGLLDPSEGHILSRGRSIQQQLLIYKSELGYVPEVPHLYPYLSGREYLELVGALRRIPAATVRLRADALLDLLALEGERHSTIASYSKGMRQKTLIAAALLHNPLTLIFDEPLSGLDVTTSLIFRHLVSQLARVGKIIIYSSHMLESVERICSRVIILDCGRVVAYDSVERLRELRKRSSLEDVFTHLVVKSDPQDTANQIVQAIHLDA